ncbi:hypothetical protein SB00610_04903 [Klebsiella quasipneumoniae subsp. similipneumoniae]|nr:hypothetical protein SB00610_04903 [Klebsiella quasipneumoniae subsp. similipneumoniae]
MIQAAEADIVGPAVAADQPDGFLHQRVGIGQQLFSALHAGQRLAQGRHLFTARFRRRLGMQRRVQLCRQLVGEFAQQAHHALTMLIDG